MRHHNICDSALETKEVDAPAGQAVGASVDPMPFDERVGKFLGTRLP